MMTTIPVHLLTMAIIAFLFDALHPSGKIFKTRKHMERILFETFRAYGTFALVIGCIIAIWFARDFVRNEWRAFTYRKRS